MNSVKRKDFKPGLEPAGLNFERLPAGAFVSGLAGNCMALSGAGLSALLAGRPGPALGAKLARAGFLRGRLDLERLDLALRSRLLSGWRGPPGHILTLT